MKPGEGFWVWEGKGEILCVLMVYEGVGRGIGKNCSVEKGIVFCM